MWIAVVKILKLLNLMNPYPGTHIKLVSNLKEKFMQYVKKLYIELIPKTDRLISILKKLTGKIPNQAVL